MSAGTGWLLVLFSGLGCSALKIAGYALPERWFSRPALRQLIELMPVALLAGLIVVEAIADGRHYDIDAARMAGFAVGAVAVWRKAPFIVVVVLASGTAALVRVV